MGGGSTLLSRGWRGTYLEGHSRGGGDLELGQGWRTRAGEGFVANVMAEVLSRKVVTVGGDAPARVARERLAGGGNRVRRCGTDSKSE